MAHGAEIDVDPVQTEDHVANGFGAPLGWGGRLPEELTTATKLFPPCAVCEDAEVTDADESVGHDVEQEPPDELLGIECHHLAGVAVGAVLPAEADEPAIEGENAFVGDGYAMCVAREVVEDLLRAGEGGLAVDDPGLVAKSGEPA